jgi:hypothetical protein
VHLGSPSKIVIMPQFRGSFANNDEQDVDPYQHPPSTPDSVDRGDRFVSPRAGRPATSNRRPSQSVSLVCISPDSRSIHSLIKNNGVFCIETRRLPLQDDETPTGVMVRSSESDSESENELPAVIRTKLPDWVQSTLEVDAPRELLCVQGDIQQQKSSKTFASPNSQRAEHERGMRRPEIPRLCLYTRKTALLLQLTYPSVNHGLSGPVQGEVVSVVEPFKETFLDSSFSQKIIRIRAGPQPSQGYSTFCPPSSLAMLTISTELNRYSLLLYHKDGTMTTTPMIHEFEQLVEREEQIVDFSFCHSTGLSLFSSLSVLLLKGSGDIMTVSPIVFDGTIIPRSLVQEGLDYLSDEMETLDRWAPRFRQCQAAQRYVLDVFPVKDKRSHYVTAQLGSVQGSENCAARWPAQVQGPVVFATADEPGPTAMVIESFGSTDMVGAAIGRDGGSVDFAVISPTALLPRFALESMDDRYDLDDHVCKLGRFVDYVSMTPSETTPPGALALVKDPVVDSLLHCVTPTSVRTISTNVMRTTSRELQGGSPDSARTTAWSCLSATAQATVQGVVVSGDAALGHMLIARLDNGTLVPISVTEAQTVHEMDALLPRVTEERKRVLAMSSSDTPSDEALRHVESTPPLYEKISPLMKQINSGLAGMGKIVGTSTRYTDITPDALSVANNVKERCDKEIVLPLLELRKVVELRQEKLKAVLQGQQDQVDVIKKTVADLKERMSSIAEKMEISESNAQSLSQRSSFALQASQDMLPTITEAEYDYFQLLKTLEVRCKRDEERISLLKEVFAKQRDAVDKDQGGVTIPETENDAKFVELAHKTLIGNEVTLKSTRERLNTSESRVKKYSQSAGLGVNA